MFYRLEKNITWHGPFKCYDRRAGEPSDKTIGNDQYLDINKTRRRMIVVFIIETIFLSQYNQNERKKTLFFNFSALLLGKSFSKNSANKQLYY